MIAKNKASALFRHMHEVVDGKVQVGKSGKNFPERLKPRAEFDWFTQAERDREEQMDRHFDK